MRAHGPRVRTALGLGVVRRRGGQDFDGDRPIDASVPPLVDLAHAASAERADDLVRAEPGSDCECHGSAGIVSLISRQRLAI